MKSRVQLRQAARDSLRGKWLDAVIFSLLISLILGALSALGGGDLEAGDMLPVNYFYSILEILVIGAFSFGSHRYFLQLAKNKLVRYGMMFDGFNYYFKTLWLTLLKALKIMLWGMTAGIPALIFVSVPNGEFMWLFLTLIPITLATIRYSQAWYVLADNPSLSANEALKASCKLMRGHWWEYVCLQLSFVPWMLVSIVTFGLGFAWLVPYMSTTSAHYYLQLRPSFFEKLKTKIIGEEQAER